MNIIKTLCPFIGLILIFEFQHSVSQEYLPFPQDSAVWYSVNSWPEPFPPPPIWYTTYKYETDGDTIINDIEYTKLYINSIPSSTQHYQGAYRVDNENECVYYVDSYYGTESLLYDFSMEPGDTVIITGSDYDPYNLVCLDTSTVIINNIPHRSYEIYSYLSNGTECYTTWIRGIGSLRIPIETDMFCASSFEWTYDLSCFFFEGEHIYEWTENPYFEGCIGTNVSVVEAQTNNSYSVSPNPVIGTSRLINNSVLNSLFDYQIMDFDGNILQEATNVEVSEIIIQNYYFYKGLYILRLYAHQNERYYFLKFIIV